MPPKRNVEVNKSSDAVKTEQQNATKRQKPLEVQCPESLDASCDRLLLLLSSEEHNNDSIAAIIKTILLRFKPPQPLTTAIVTEFTKRDLISHVVQFMDAIPAPKEAAADLIYNCLMVLNNAIAATKDQDGTFARLMGTTDSNKLMSLLVECMNGAIELRYGAFESQRFAVQEIPFHALWVMHNICLSENSAFKRKAVNLGAINAIWRHLSQDVRFGLTMHPSCLERAVALFGVLAALKRILYCDTRLLLDLTKSIFEFRPNNGKSLKGESATDTEWTIAACRIIVHLFNHSRDKTLLTYTIHTGIASMILRIMVQFQVNDGLKLHCMKVMTSCTNAAKSLENIHELTNVVGLLSELRLLFAVPNIWKHVILEEMCNCLKHLWVNSFRLAYCTSVVSVLDERSLVSIPGDVVPYPVDSDEMCTNATTTVTTERHTEDMSDAAVSDAMRESSTPVESATSILGAVVPNSVDIDEMCTDDTITVAMERHVEDMSDVVVSDAMCESSTAGVDNSEQGVEDISTIVNVDGVIGDAVSAAVVVGGEEGFGVLTNTVSLGDEESNSLRRAIVDDLKSVMRFLPTLPRNAPLNTVQQRAALMMLAALLGHTSVLFELRDLLSNGGFVEQVVDLFPSLLCDHKALDDGSLIVATWLKSIETIVDESIRWSVSKRFCMRGRCRVTKWKRHWRRVFLIKWFEMLSNLTTHKCKKCLDSQQSLTFKLRL